MQATGFMDLDGVTTIAKMDNIILAGGNKEKESSVTFSQGGVQTKAFLGDKYGLVHLVDVSRKLILDKIELQKF